MNADHLKQMFQSVADALSDQREYLGELDAVAGDGDLGVTMSTGFTAVAQEFSDSEEDDIGKVLLAAAQTLNRTSPSTIGTLFATALLRAGKQAMGRTEVTALDWADLIEAARQGIEARGKAKQGDKTVLDALVPAEEAWKRIAASGGSLSECAKAALEAAREGVEATRALTPKIGRASWLKEQSTGQPDPGAAALVVILAGVVGYLDKEDII
ncbi:MAG: dihydroxyacetone kinase subunit DhaL [Candidatus Bipolaricaulia bacterium]